jgi:integrase
MAGRPPLRLGQHGKVTRKNLGNGVWLARCRFRDSDGVTRIVERRSPLGESDQHGKLAEDALIAALQIRRAPGAAGKISLDTRIGELVKLHLERLEEDGKSPSTMTTYRSAERKFQKFIGALRVAEATPARLDAAIRSMRTAHGANMARHGRTLMRGALQLAVMASVLGSNPVRDVSPIVPKSPPKGAVALTGEQLRDLLGKIATNEYCVERDLADPITILMATGFRRSELLALQWSDYDPAAGTLSVTGKIARISGEGLKRLDSGKTVSSRRTVVLPGFAVEALKARRARPFWGEQKMIFPSTTGSWRDPDAFDKQWRKVRGVLGVPEVTSHSFRKTVADLIDGGGLSARVGADQLGQRESVHDPRPVHVVRPLARRGRSPSRPDHYR